MEYLALAQAYRKIEGTSKRLEIIEYLADIFRESSPSLVGKIAFMLQGKIAPDFEGMEFGVAEKLALLALVEATGIPEAEVTGHFRKTGDIGETAFVLLPGKKQMSLFPSRPLVVEEVFDKYRRIARASGHGSQELKLKLIANLLHDAKPLEARYLMRTFVGKLRLGVADMTVIEALAAAFATRPDRPVVEEAYNRCSNMGHVSEIMAREGLPGLEIIDIEVGIPLRSMLAERSRSIEEILERMEGKAAFEYKYDGLRVQAHIMFRENSRDPPRVRLFSRQLEDITSQFPDVAGVLATSVRCDAIVEGECVPVDRETGAFRPFQDVSHRRGRKNDLASAVKDYPVALFLFDCLYAAPGKDTGVRAADLPFLKRREILESIVTPCEGIRLSELRVLQDSAKIEEFFEESLSHGCEGLMAKSVSGKSVYRAGARGWQWIKYKAEYRSDLIDTLDLVVVGAFAGKGRRAGVYGAFLMAAWNPGERRYETVCKLGTGFDDEMLMALPGLLGPYLNAGTAPVPYVHTKMKPDYHFYPGLVLEIFGAEFTFSPIHTCAQDVLQDGAGIALRFPRFTGRIRDDKGPEDATTTDEIIGFYRTQTKKRHEKPARSMPVSIDNQS